MTRIRARLAQAVDQASEKLEEDFAQFVNTAVRERLEKLGFWPQVEPDPDKKK